MKILERRNIKYIIGHPKEEYDAANKYHRNYKSEEEMLFYISEEYNLNDIKNITKSKDGYAIIWVLRNDNNGGLNQIELIDDFDEVYNLINSYII